LKAKLFLLSILFSVILLSNSFGFTTLNITARVGSLLSLSMGTPDAFDIVDSNNNLISTRMVGNPSVVSNYKTWYMLIDSTYKATLSTGRLKLDGFETYIPYTFAIKSGETTILSQFNTPSLVQPITSSAGASYSLHFYFTDDDTIWPQGIYRDTLVLTVTTD
jgi:hypothetical protein